MIRSTDEDKLFNTRPFRGLNFVSEPQYRLISENINRDGIMKTSDSNQTKEREKDCVLKTFPIIY